MLIRRILLPALAAALAAACAVPLSAEAAKAAGPQPRVSLDRAAETMLTTGTLGVDVTVVVPRAAPSAAVRLRFYAPDGSLAYQSTKSLGRLPAGPRTVRFEQGFSGRALDEGRGRVEVRASVAGFGPVTAEGPVYVVDGSRPPLPLSVIVRFPAALMSAPDGTFATDPAAEPSARFEAEAFGALAVQRPDLNLSFALPPAMLDEWSRVAAGYRLADPSRAPVPQTGATAIAYSRTLSVLGSAVERGVPLLAVPYADPSPADLASIGALDDLGRQLDLGALVASETLGPRDVLGLAVAGGSVPASAAPALSARGLGFVLLDPQGALTGGGGTETTAAPGTHPIGETTLTALVVDTGVSEMLARPSSARAEVLDGLFGRLTAKDRGGQPVVAVVGVGPGSTATVGELQATLAAIASMGWIRFVTAPVAATMPPGAPVTLPGAVSAPAAPAAPETYLAAVRTARDRAVALADAAGPADADASAALRDAMIAESSAWSGPSTGRDLERGAAFAAAADARAWAVLSRLTLAVPNVTLAGSAGRVPVSVSNNSGKSLQLTLRATRKGVRLPKGRTTVFLAPPGETILFVPVETGSAVSGSVRFDLAAGTLVLASGTAVVRASYMDRIFIVGTVMLVLLGLLWYIRSRGRGSIGRVRGATGEQAGPEPR